MRQIVLEALKTAIRSSMASQLPEFKFYAKSMRGDEKGLLRFRREINDQFSLYVVFRPLNSESVEIRVGWSTKGRCPVATVVINGESDIFDFERDEMMVQTIVVANRNGLADWPFWCPSEELIDNPDEFGKRYAEHHMKELTMEEALDLIGDPLVNGLTELMQFGIPYLEKKVESWKKGTR